MAAGKTGTLVDLLDGVQHITDRGYTFLSDDLQPSEWSFAQIAEESRRRAEKFRALGLNKGDRLAMIIPDAEDFVLSFFGAVRAGIIPVPMYPPLALAKLDGYIDNAARILTTGRAKLLLTTKKVEPILWSLVSRVKTLENIVLAESLRSPKATSEVNNTTNSPTDDVTVTPADTCFLQFTSGSTADPKGVVVTHASLWANAAAIMVDGLKTASDRDRGVSWLPLYHDMGLIGFVIAPLRTAVPVVFIPTMSFVKRPSVWMKTIHDYRGTITFAPNFAFGLAAKRAPKNTDALDLSCLRVLGCGAEPINRKTLDTFVSAFQPMGLNPNAIMPCYGMAEATLAISFDRLDQPYHALRIDRNAYEEEHIARPFEGEASDVLDLVACGRTFPDHEIAILDDAGRELGEGRVGEIVFAGPSVTQGYFENPAASVDMMHGGRWLRTGDLGFILDGDLYISGRKKDLIILNGRNYYPQSIEWEIEHIAGIRKGNVVAFSSRADDDTATEELVVVAESKVDDKDALAQTIKKHVKDTSGLAVAHAIVVGPGVLPKTSSGKLQRRRTKLLYEAKQLGLQGNRSLGSAATRVMLARHVTASALARLRHRISGVFPFGSKSGASATRNVFASRRRADSR